MPVTLKKQGGKYRVCERGGAIAKNKAGTAVDGGGHADKLRGIAQVAAINSSLKRKGKI